MSIVDKLIYKYERLDGDIDELVPASLARQLEAHCEALADDAATGSAVREYEKWRERMK